MNREDLVSILVPACVVSACLGAFGTYFYLGASKKAPPVASAPAAEPAPAQAAKAAPLVEAPGSGLSTIQMMRMDPAGFLNKTVKLYVYLKPTDYFNYGYRTARDSHFGFEACDGEGNRQNCANFYIVKDKGRELLQTVLANGGDKYHGPVSIIASNLKFRYESASSELFEILDYRIGEDKALSAAGYTVPDLFTQMGIVVTRLETRWEARDQQSYEGPLWVPVVRLYLKNSGSLSLRDLELDGNFISLKNNESFGTGSGSLSYRESLEPGQTRFLDVSASIGYRGSPPYPLPEIKADLILNKGELGSVTFTGEKMDVTSVKLEALKAVAAVAQATPAVPAQPPRQQASTAAKVVPK